MFRIILLVLAISLTGVGAESADNLNAIADTCLEPADNIFRPAVVVPSLSGNPRLAQRTKTVRCPSGQTRVDCSLAWKCCSRGGRCVDDFPFCN